MGIEHPVVTYINRTGYPQDMQETHWGSDYNGNEIMHGDNIVFDPNTDEVILEEDLQEYLVNRLGFQFKVAE